MTKSRDYKKDWQAEKARQKKNPDVLQNKLERQRARRKLDAEGVPRKGKDIAHKVALIEGGSNKDGYFLDSPHNNRAFARKSNHKPKSRTDKP